MIDVWVSAVSDEHVGQTIRKTIRQELTKKCKLVAGGGGVLSIWQHFITNECVIFICSKQWEPELTITTP